MRQAFRDVKQISGNENPIRLKLCHGVDNAIMPRVISVKVQVGQMNGTTTSENGMFVGEDRDLMIGQPPFPMRGKAEDSIERLAQAIADE